MSQDNAQLAVVDGTFSSKTEVVDHNIVKCTYAIRKNEKATRYVKNSTFDFSGVSREQLLLLAMYGVKVKTQSLLRDMSDPAFLNSATLRDVDVLRDVINAQRAPADPATAAKRALSKMSRDEIATILAEYGATEQQSDE
jgi:hypothetical protein